MLMSNAVSKLAEQTAGKEAVAMEAFARALRQVLSNHLFLCLPDTVQLPVPLSLRYCPITCPYVA